jgi:hypothetical protein
MSIGKMTISEAYPHLKEIADIHGLRLNRVNDFRLARVLLAIKYGSQQHI